MSKLRKLKSVEKLVKVREYRHNLNTMLIRALYRLFFEKNHRGHLFDMGLEHNQICNFQKLKYWKLVKKVSTEKASSGGYWQLTKIGIKFIKNKITIPKYVITCNGEVVEYEGEKLGVEDILPGFYKRRAAYAGGF